MTESVAAVVRLVPSAVVTWRKIPGVAVKRGKVGLGVSYRAMPRRNTRIEWLGEKRAQEGAAGRAVTIWRLAIDAWRWSCWLITVLVTPFVFTGFFVALLLIAGPLCLVLVCIGKRRVALEVIKEIPLVPPMLRQVLVPPRTGVAQRAFRTLTRHW